MVLTRKEKKDALAQQVPLKAPDTTDSSENTKKGVDKEFHDRPRYRLIAPKVAFPPFSDILARGEQHRPIRLPSLRELGLDRYIHAKPPPGTQTSFYTGSYHEDSEPLDRALLQRIAQDALAMLQCNEFAARNKL
ncbi:hypothetical protein ABKA04_001402 [Annulohypoxylon sp. FPYF3050]